MFFEIKLNVSSSDKQWSHFSILVLFATDSNTLHVAFFPKTSSVILRLSSTVKCLFSDLEIHAPDPKELFHIHCLH